MPGCMNRLTRIWHARLLSAVLIACSGCATKETDNNAGVNDNLEAQSDAADKLDFYTVHHYDKARNPADDLATTIQRAKVEKKYILVQVGGDWCGWCKLMSQYIETNERVRENIRRNYLIMKVSYEGEQTNEAFLSRYPQIPGYPHVFVLDSDGKFLHSQGTAELEEGRGYNEQVYLEFLNKWKPGGSAPKDIEPRSTSTSNRLDATGIEISVERPTDIAPVTAGAVVSPKSASAGDVVTLTVRVRIAKGWHIYGVRAGGGPAQPTKLNLTLPDEITAPGDWTAPTPEYETTALGISPVYQGEVDFSRKLKVSDSAVAGAVNVVCKVDYQACDHSKCLPPANIALTTTLEVSKR
jgi:thioredoxin-related protein